MILFDLEFYVPPQDRGGTGRRGSLKFNPSLPDHLILGGHFIKANFSTGKILESTSAWLWEFGSESQLLQQIYTVFSEGWAQQRQQKIKALHTRVRDLVTCGFAIGRVDLPALYIRSVYHQIAPPDVLFSIFLNSKAIDLANVASAFFPEDPTCYPKTQREAAQKLGFSPHQTPPGNDVWALYDRGDFAGIAARCRQEVEEVAKIYRRLQKVIQAGQLSKISESERKK